MRDIPKIPEILRLIDQLNQEEEKEGQKETENSHQPNHLTT
jgi:hypothetical protein